MLSNATARRTGNGDSFDGGRLRSDEYSHCRGKPWITLHGHSHSAVDRMKGKFVFDIGYTKSVLVGAGNDPNVLNYIILDLRNRIMERQSI